MFARFVRAIFGLVVLTAIVTPGCKRSFSAPKADPAKAREVLKQGLDAWKSGTSNDSFQSSSSITFVDPQWKKGAKLVKYEMKGDGQAFGHDWQCKVTLTVKDDKGEKNYAASYSISTTPKQVVTRGDVR